MKIAGFVVAGALALGCLSCTPRERARSDDPAATALRLFETARGEAANEAEATTALFDLEAGARGRGRLLDAISRLREVSNPHVLATTPLEDGSRAVVDVAANLAAGGSASYSIALRRVADGTWRVTAFWGPGVAWPDRVAGPAEGLSVSPPPR